MAHRITSRILIVDDDDYICKTLSAILQSEGYKTSTATTAKEAVEEIKTNFFNLALLDIKLPDKGGIQLLAQLQETTPETIKIVVTGYPSVQNAVEALNLGADSYVMKPIDPAELMKLIRNKLEAKQEAEEITKEKLTEWVQSQARKKQSSNFEDFLEETASELACFGLTKTQAKTYVTLTALGFASASGIAALSKIRREEVYRTIPTLENHGIVIRKLDAPRKFSAVQPEKAIQLLIKTKLRTMKEEIDKLEQKQVQLISKLKTIELPVYHDDFSIDVVYKQDLLTKLVDMTQHAKREIDAILSLENLKYTYLNSPKSVEEKPWKAIKIRIITENHEPDAFTKEIIQYSEASNNRVELKQARKLSFNLIIVDHTEAMWGEFQHKNKNAQNLWTNDPIQISILNTSFESLWKKSSRIRKIEHG
jgi:DNA-binding response OmpR family regulator